MWSLVLLVGALALVAGGIRRAAIRNRMSAPRHRRRTPRGWPGLVTLGLGLVGVAVTTAALLGATTGRSTSIPSTQPVRPAALTPGVVPAPAVVVEAARPTVRPVQLDIPRIGVRTPLVELRVRRGVLQPPSDSARAGWYPRSATPGDLGAAVIVGHLDSKSGRAVFYRLGSLRPGDRMTVTLSDGSHARFAVQEVRQVPRDRFPTKEVYGATPDRALRLITCGGRYDAARGGYQDNVLVLALAV